MIKQIYIALKAHLLAKVPDLRHVALFNQQVSLMLAERNEDNPWPFPACFIDFGNADIEYQVFAQGVQTGKMQVRLLLVTQSLLEEDLSIFDLKEKVHAAASTFSMPKVSPLVRVIEGVSNDFTNVNTFELNYSVSFTDTSVLEASINARGQARVNRIDLKVDGNSDGVVDLTYTIQ